MPRKTKEAKEIEKEVKKKETKTSKTKKAKVDSKETKATTKKAEKISKKASKKTDKKNEAKLNEIKKDLKKAVEKEKVPKKSTTEKSTPKATTSKKTSTKKSSTKTTKSTSSKSKATKKASQKSDIVEYYDLPYRYNQTIVKILAQTPTTLFIYWDISDEDRELYKKQFGENFFETTRPILKIFNDTMNYSFEIEINDFANSWYLHVNDAKCDYRVELGRRPIYTPADIGGTDYVYISTSNEIEAPNDRILIDQIQNMVYFRNVKTNQIIGRSIANLSFLRNMGKIYNIYDLYRELYKEEDLEDIYNPSSKFF